MSQPPLKFEEFLELYQQHLAAPDRPHAFIAYCRAEADVFTAHGCRRFKNHKVFRNVMSRHRMKNRKNTKKNVLDVE